MRIHVTTRLFVATALLLVGCEDEKDRILDPSPPTYLEPTSPENVLANLRTAYGARDADRYLNLLDVNFRFYSDPTNDVDFDQLTRAEDMSTTVTMFGLVASIDMDFETLSPRSMGAGSVEIPFQNLTIRVETREGAASDPLVFLIEGSGRFILTSTTETETTWRLAAIHDDGAPRRTQERSWTNLKSIYGFVAYYLPPTSPENVVENLSVAYRHRDIASYTNTLADEFVFYPSPGDLVPFLLLSRAEDIQSTTTMFDAVSRIDARLWMSPSVPSNDPSYPAVDGFRIVDVTDVGIRIVTTSGTDPLIYLVQGNLARFVLAPDDAESPSDWRIAAQFDLGIGFRRTEESRWGTLKAIYLP